jgi:pyruvate formate lyase activating enzyme
VEACPEEALELIQGSDNKIKINRESCRLSGNCVRVCPSGAMQFTGYSETVSGIMDEIEKDLVFFQESGGGITLTGGEPLFQPEFALGILKACKEKGEAKADIILDALNIENYEILKNIFDKLLIVREEISENDLKSYAKNAAINKNIANCKVFFCEKELFDICCASINVI